MSAQGDETLKQDLEATLEKVQTQVPPVAEAAADSANAAAEEDAETLRARIAELEGCLKDEELRAAAHLQNLNRRHQEELQNAYKFAAAKFAGEILSVKDYLEMALMDQSGNFDALKMGVEMTLKEMEKAFSQAHIAEIKAEGEILDPQRHHAVDKVADAEVAPNTIVRVLQKGYSLNERVLRPARVVVAAAAEDGNA